MRYYQPNPACGCARCSTRGLMGPAVLITLGLLFLAANYTEWSFERTWPILLIVIGLIKVVRYLIGDSGHVNPGQFVPYGTPYGQYPPPYAGYQAPVAPAAAQAAPAQMSPETPFGEAAKTENGGSNEVNHG